MHIEQSNQFKKSYKKLFLNQLPETNNAIKEEKAVADTIAPPSAQGLSPQKIASRLNLSLAEVDLALNLLQRSGN